MFNLAQYYHVLLAQTQVTTATGKAAADAASGAGPTDTPPAPSFFESMQYFLPAMLGVMLVYFIMTMRPQAKDAPTAKRLKELKKNDRVVTAGGILGTIVNTRPDEEYTTIRIDDSGNAKMQVLTSSIIRVLSDETDSKTAGSS